MVCRAAKQGGRGAGGGDCAHMLSMRFNRRRQAGRCVGWGGRGTELRCTFHPRCHFWIKMAACSSARVLLLLLLCCRVSDFVSPPALAAVSEVATAEVVAVTAGSTAASVDAAGGAPACFTVTLASHGDESPPLEVDSSTGARRRTFACTCFG